jgi:hypothetical protein
MPSSGFAAGRFVNKRSCVSAVLGCMGRVAPTDAGRLRNDALRSAGILILIQKPELYTRPLRSAKFIHQAFGLVRCGGGGRLAGLGGVKGGAKGAFDEFGAVDFHGRKGTKFAGEFFGFEGEGFFGGFAADKFGGEAGNRDGGFATEGLEGGAVDHFPTAFFLEFDPHSQHLAAAGVADGADGVGVGEFAYVLRVLQGLFDPFLQVGIHESL